MLSKRCMMCTLLGGMAVIVYLKYKDGTINRMIKNVKPVLVCTLDELRK